MSNPRSFDRTRNFGGGVDMYRAADEIDLNQSTLMQNMVVLDNFSVRTRPGFLLVDSNPGGSFAANVTTAACQGLWYFQAPGTFSTGLLIGAEGGKLYGWNGTSWSGAWSPTLLSSVILPDFDQGLNAGLFTLADGSGGPVYWDGGGFTSGHFASYVNADDASYGGGTNFFVGCTICCWVGSAGRMLLSGNPAYPETVFASLLLAYSPHSVGGAYNWDSAKLSINVGNGDGDPVMALAQMQDQTVAVLKQQSVWLLDMSTLSLNPVVPTANWSIVEQGSLVGGGIGCVGRDAWCNYQNDVLFMSADGVQSVQRMQAATGQYQLTAPLSRAIQPLINRINWSMAYLIRAVNYRQLAIFYVPLDGASVNNYALVWNGRLYNNQTGIFGQWTGHWTGLNASASCITQFSSISAMANASAGEQLVIGDGSSGTTKGYISAWQDGATSLDINSVYFDNSVPVEWELDTRAFTFGNLDALKKMRMVLARFNTGFGTINVSAELDLIDLEDWNENLSSGGAVLPVLLPFVLALNKTFEAYRTLSGLNYCNEVIFKFSGTTSWAEIRNITSSAFLKSVRDPLA